MQANIAAFEYHIALKTNNTQKIKKIRTHSKIFLLCITFLSRFLCQRFSDWVRFSIRLVTDHFRLLRIIKPKEFTIKKKSKPNYGSNDWKIQSEWVLGFWSSNRCPHNVVVKPFCIHTRNNFDHISLIRNLWDLFCNYLDIFHLKLILIIYY